MTVKSLQFQLAMLKGGEKGLATYASASQAAKASGDASADAADAAAAKGPAPDPAGLNPALWMWNLMADATRPSTIQ